MSPWLFSALRKYRLPIAGALFLSLLVSGLNLVNPIVSGRLVDTVIIGGHTESLWLFLGLMFGSIVIKSFIRYGYQMIFEHVSQSVLQQSREKLFARLQGLDSGYFDKTKTGDLMAHMTGDMDAVRHFIAWVIYQCFENGSIFVISIVTLFFVDWEFTLILLAVTPFVAWAAIGLSRRVKPTFSRVREQFSRLNSMVQENIAGNRVVKALAREDYETRKFQAENDAFRDRNLEAGRVWGRFIPLIEFGSGLLPVIVILVGGILIIDGRMTLGELVTFNGLIWAINNPLRMAGWLVNDIQRFNAARERLDRLFKIQSVLPESPRGVKVARVSGLVEFRGVSFSYGDEEVLSDISFVARPGETIGILGPTGSGKSSIARLLYRAYDRSGGEILVDGLDIADYELRCLRDNVGIAMQDVFLFSDTIEGNIAFGKPDAPMGEVLAASRLASAHEFIEKLPEGYDTIIGERGVGLSGGQRQRLALARLLLKDPQIMILDDTSSAVDLETEKHIQEAMKSLRGKRTMFIIAHRLSSIKHADQILVIYHGKINERGSHEELLAQKGYYAEVWRHQGSEAALARV